MKKAFQTFLCSLAFFAMQNTANAQCQVTTVSTSDGANTAYTCPQDGDADVVEFANTNTSGSGYAYAITDSDNNILTTTTGSQFDFDPAPPGNCLVWGFSYTGDITAMEGESVFSTQFSTGCWNISQNAISIVRDTPDGGTVATPQGETSVYACLDDGIPDFVGFTNTSTSNAAYTYVITDDQNNILGLPGIDFLDFSGAGPGVCRVWGLSYTGNITAVMGDNAAAVELSDGCFSLSANFITVTRNNVDGGTVAMPSGATYRQICSLDGNPDIVMFVNTSTSAANYAYAITDSDNNILTTTTDSQFDFDDAPTGTCRIWGFSYTGAISAVAGESVFSTQLSEGCFQISSTAITVSRTGVDGGSVAMPSGATVRYTCPGDGEDDIVMFTHETSTPSVNYAYVITDEQNNILGLPPGNSQNFEGAGVGVCRVWGLAYTGNITAGMGDNAAAVALSDGCFSLSENFIEIVRDNPDGGTVATAAGETTIELCAGDGNDDFIDFSHVTSSMSAYRYVVTDDQNNILGLPPGNTVNFEGAGQGTCRVWGLSYTGSITAEMGDNAAAIALSDGCFELSSNFVTVVRTGVDGGTVAMPSGATVRYTCPGDGTDDIVMFTHETSAPTANYTYVITDDQNNILGLPPGNSQNFEGAGTGVCRVWGLSYTGNITAEMGDNAAAVALSDGCFALSGNFIEVIRDNPDGGTVATAAGEMTIELCAGDGNDDFVDFSHVTSSMSAYRYVVTDDQNNILGLPPGNMVNFEGAGTGVCRVWGLSYTGMVTAQMGDNAADVALSDGCFELSSNFVTVVRTGVDGGEVTTSDGATSTYTCPGDGVDDVIQFAVTTTEAGANQQLVVTDNALNVLGLPPGNEVNFEGAGVGECWVWNLSYTGNLNLQMGENVADVPNLSDGCFSLSDAFVTVNRDEPDGGMVTTAAGETTVTITAGDGIDDIIEFAHTGASNSLFTYVITDDQNNILGIPPGNSQNFEGAGPGVCRVWGLAYTGEIIAGMGDNAADVSLTDGCFDLSDNFIEVTRLDQFTGGGVIQVSLSPNPTPNVLFVEMNMEKKATAETTVVTVYHLSGQVMHQQKFATHEEQNRFQLNLGHLEEGFYKVAIQNGRALEQVSFVKQ